MIRPDIPWAVFPNLVAAGLPDSGAWFEPIPRPKGVRKGRDRLCFSNASQIRSRDELRWRYCEGVAYTGISWVHHAWVLDVDDKAVEVTWPSPGDAYFGAVIDPKDEAEAILRSGHFGVFF